MEGQAQGHGAVRHSHSMGGTGVDAELLLKAAHPIASGAHPTRIQALAHVGPGFSATEIGLMQGHGLGWIGCAAHLAQGLQDGAAHTA